MLLVGTKLLPGVRQRLLIGLLMKFNFFKIAKQ